MHLEFWLLLPPDARSHLKMSAQIDQRIFSNKCIDRPNGKLHDWGSFTQRTAAALVVYLLTVPKHAVPTIFFTPGKCLNNRGCHWDWAFGRHKKHMITLRLNERGARCYLFLQHCSEQKYISKCCGKTRVGIPFLNLGPIFGPPRVKLCMEALQVLGQTTHSSTANSWQATNCQF